MGSVYKQPKDISCYLDDDVVVYVDKDGNEYTVKWIKQHILNVHGVVAWNVVPVDVKDGINKLTKEQKYKQVNKKQIWHRSNKPKARIFDMDYVPIKLKKHSNIICVPMPMLIDIVNGRYTQEGLFNIYNHFKGHYTEKEILSALCLIPEAPFKKLPMYGDISLKSFYDDLHKLTLDDNNPNKMKVIDIQYKYRGKWYKNGSPLHRKFITDACFVVYVMTDKKVNLFTDKAENVGVCVLTPELWKNNIEFLDVIKEK